MKSKKYQQQIHDKYMPKIQFVINVLKSCKTGDQVTCCVKWGENLFRQWQEHERRKIVTGLGTASFAIKRMGLLEKEFESLHNTFNSAVRQISLEPEN